MDLKGELQKFFKGDIADDAITLKKYSRDASLFEIVPQLVVAPKDTKDIEELVKLDGIGKKTAEKNPAWSLSYPRIRDDKKRYRASDR